MSIAILEISIVIKIINSVN